MYVIRGATNAFEKDAAVSILNCYCNRLFVTTGVKILEANKATKGQVMLVVLNDAQEALDRRVGFDIDSVSDLWDV